MAADPSRPPRRRGRLTAEDRALWDKVAASVTPLASRAPTRPEPEPGAGAEPVAETAPTAPAPVAARPPPKAPPPLAPIDRRTALKLGRGAVAIDDRLDLHGLTQDAARRRLLDFLSAAQARGDKLVLVITGKGRDADADPLAGPRGILKRVVPEWLGAPMVRGLVVGFSPARPQHGGAGALYVRLRRPRGTPDRR
jgi:DNA-nicking Smr family endonuclease